MSQSTYNPTQEEILKNVESLVGQLIEIEKLEARRYQCGNINTCLDQAIADIELDLRPPYDVLEEKLRTELTRALNLGLGEDPYIRKITTIAFPVAA